MLSNEKWFGASADFYSETIDQSARFDGSSSQLNITPSSTGNRKTFTTSLWVKRSKISSAMELHTGGSNSYNTQSTQFSINSSDQLQFYDVLAGITNYAYVRSENLLRDISNWYHIVLAVDTTQSTASDRVKLYLNGSEVSYVSSPTYPSQNHDTVRNNSGTVTRIGRFPNVAVNYFSGYIAEFNHIDGTALTPSSFGETKNGLWIPKEISGLTYGTNGFRFTFADSSSLGDDTSGNGNDYTSSGLASTDVVSDSPTNNFAILNSLQQRSNSSATFSEGNLKVVGASASTSGIMTGTFGVSSGKWYWEVRATGSAQYLNTGIVYTAFFNTGTGDTGYYSNEYVYVYSGVKYNNASSSAYGASYTSGDIIGVALDLDAGTVTFYKNGSSQGVAFSSLPSGTYLPVFDCYNSSSWILNAGQEGSFAGNETAGGNSDGNGIGNFKYAVPSGHLALCSSNLPEPSLSANQSEQADDHFNTVLYTGNGSTTQNINIGFNPDWVWIKSTSSGSGHHSLIDSSRGDLAMNSNQTIADYSVAEFNFKTDNTIDVPYYANDYSMNTSSATYVAWNWKAGGTTPTKTYKVVVVSDSGNKYRFRNSADSATFAQSAVTLDLQEGGTYTFDWSDSSAQGHPIRFSTTSDGTHGGGSEYTTGVVKDDSAYKTTITVASSAPTLYYYCANHSGMGGQVDTNTTRGQTNFNGSILSVEQSNTTAGLSISTYTGNGSASTVGHDLGVAPAVYFVKNRDVNTHNWILWHQNLATNGFIALNLTQQAYYDSARFTSNTPTSSVFYVGTDASTNANNEDFVAFAFAEVEGYSKFGSYTGNGSTDGTFVYTGFRPAWVLLKRTTSSFHWVLMDSVNDPINAIDSALLPAGTNASGTGYTVDFLSNGFKLRLTGTAMNASSAPHIYLAFAEQPFKFSNAR